MAGEVKFGTSMFGYDKNDVEIYLETLVEQCQHRIEKKDKEVADIKFQLSKEAEEAINAKDQEISKLKDIVDALKQEITQVRETEISEITSSKDLEIDSLKKQVEYLENQVYQMNQEQLLLTQQVNQFKEQAELLKSRNLNLEERENMLAVEREKITNAFILASEKAENIVSEANDKASQIVDEALMTSLENRQQLEELVEKEREKLVDVKREMRELKAGFATMLKKYEEEIDIAAGDI